MKIKKLLFVTKFEDIGFDTLQKLLALRESGLEHIVFLYVIERDKVALHRGAGYLKTEEVKLKEKANIRFIDWAENLFEQGMEVGVYIVVGSLVHQIVTSVKKEEADLIVIGHQKKGKLKYFYPKGDELTELIHRSPVPVLICKYFSESEKSEIKLFDRVLLSINWSPSSLNAVEYLKDIKEVIQHLDVIQVISEKDLKSDSAMDVQKTRKESRKKLDELCEVFGDYNIEARSHVYVGDPIEEIEKAARECQSSIIIAGISNEDSWADIFKRSISATLAEKSIVPILLVPGK